MVCDKEDISNTITLEENLAYGKRNKTAVGVCKTFIL